MKKTILITFLAIAGTYFGAYAQQPAVVASDKAGWHKIAETSVDLTKDHDEVAVMGADRFASIKFKVTDAGIDLQDVVVYYEHTDKEKTDVDKQDIIVRSPIQAGGESRVIDLKGGAERSIKKISFVYKTLPNQKNEKAHVEIWGMKTNTVE
jgi:hypothetical protein